MIKTPRFCEFARLPVPTFRSAVATGRTPFERSEAHGHERYGAAHALAWMAVEELRALGLSDRVAARAARETAAADVFLRRLATGEGVVDLLLIVGLQSPQEDGTRYWLHEVAAPERLTEIYSDRRFSSVASVRLIWAWHTAVSRAEEVGLRLLPGLLEDLR